MKKFPTKKVAIATMIFAVSAVLMLILLCGGSVRNEKDVADFLTKQGFVCVSGADVSYVTIPAVFGYTYENYNDLQKRNGYNLSKYKSRNVKKYTIAVNYTNNETSTLAYANVLVLDDKIIGGDICSYALDGFMIGLKGK